MASASNFCTKLPILATHTHLASQNHYSERYLGSADNGGVHRNSGIANLFFCLLVRGGSNPVAKYWLRNVVGIGMEKAAKLWYTALKNYMTTSTNFAGARTATLNACSALGYSAAECGSVGDAWCEVGVGSSCTPASALALPSPAGECQGAEAYTGMLATGGNTIEPYGSCAYTSQSGIHNGCISGPVDANFDLRLEKYSPSSGWSTVASSTASGSHQAISYSGSSGYFRWLVTAAGGSGTYTLAVTHP